MLKIAGVENKREKILPALPVNVIFFCQLCFLVNWFPVVSSMPLFYDQQTVGLFLIVEDNVLFSLALSKQSL